MIRTDEGLEQTRKALIDMETILMSFKGTILPKNPARFALMAEPVVEYIRDLRRDIEDYIGYTFAVEQQSEPAIAQMLEYGPDPDTPSVPDVAPSFQDALPTGEAVGR